MEQGSVDYLSVYFDISYIYLNICAYLSVYVIISVDFSLRQGYV